jgi:hypothetical protein
VNAKSKSKSRITKPAIKKSKEQRQAEHCALIMWALLARGGSAFASEIRPEAEKAHREALQREKLITVEKRNRSNWIEVTDAGWAWAEEHLSASLPDKSYAGTAILQSWLSQLDGFLKQRKIRLFELFEVKSQPANKPEVALDYRELRNRIRATYLEVTGGKFNARALLRDIRSRISNVDRPALDQALLRIQREDDASLMQLDNRLDVTEADREAAIMIGREPRHILWISR